jgi:Na+/H+ antiporter NhaC
MSVIKGLYNLFKPSVINFILVVCIILILILIYLKYNTIDLFSIPTNTNTTTITNPITNTTLKYNILSSDDYLTSFINKYINNIQQQNSYMKTLATQQQVISNLSEQVSQLINTST